MFSSSPKFQGHRFQFALSLASHHGFRHPRMGAEIEEHTHTHTHAWALSAQPRGPSCTVAMTPPNLLQKLRDLNKTSSDFHSQLTDFLRGNEYRDAVPSLQGEDLDWFIDYLDNVSLRTVSLRSALTAGTDPLRYPRSQHRPIPGTARRTPKDMWCQERAPDHVHTLGFASGVRV